MSGEGELGASGGVRRPRPLSPLREHLRDTFWFAPAVGLLAALALAWLSTTVDDLIVEAAREEGDFAFIESLIRVASDLKSVVTTAGSAMLTFLGVVFSISLVALQMAGGQFTPRVMRLYVRSRITKVTLAVFLATFLFALMVQGSFDGESDPRKVTTVPVVSAVLSGVLVVVSLVLFIAYVNSTIRLMRVSYVIDRITREAMRVLERHGKGEEVKALPGEVVGEFAHRGRAGVLRDVHVARLTRVGRRYGTVLRLQARIGDYVVPGTPMLTAHGGRVPPRWAVRFTTSVGVERTARQDVGFGLRQLADIALRALSPAVNDPTTAVQSLDRIVTLLAVVGKRPLGAVHHRDRKGVVRLVQDLPGWGDLVDLGFSEIRGCAVGNPQVTRRLVAGIEDLLALVPAERREPLERHLALLAQAVERTVPEAVEREFALQGDRQGIG